VGTILFQAGEGVLSTFPSNKHSMPPERNRCLHIWVSGESFPGPLGSGAVVVAVKSRRVIFLARRVGWVAQSL
jgi:hypothetical protein